MLHPKLAVLIRRDGRVQLGWHSERAVIVRLPGPPDAVPKLLRLFDGTTELSQILCSASTLGFDAATTRALLEELAAAELLLPERPRGRLRTVRIHGRGPLSDVLLEGVRRIGLRAARTGEAEPARSARPDTARAARPDPARPDLVVLADALVPDPACAADLMRRRIPHLQVRIRDGHGVIGPLVLPGETSCLRCADLHRCDREPEWPRLAAQLLGRTGYASPAGVAAAAALALNELETVAHGNPSHPPATLNATLELNLDSHRLDRRRWIAHPQCDCGVMSGRVAL
ncbi:TOMM precursor leader peptide-binding protein [Nocardia huaxiensis]|uniref:TOMM leader peptide-binding protein n=2 Tax=Nocardia huaxiensis TaxID=2755382 RepID=A0A7D6Z6K9_9NOCA|nr:TOMM precursor leader peptide-binding protein [Nocardia huaxiensis]